MLTFSFDLTPRLGIDQPLARTHDSESIWDTQINQQLSVRRGYWIELGLVWTGSESPSFVVGYYG
jgi:hypothetical protein